MSVIGKLNARLEAASLMVRQREETAGTSFMARLATQSLRAHVEELQAQVQVAKKERAVEIVQVRLMGELAQAGSIPLYLLANLSQQFADAIHAASQKLKSGRRVRRISPNIIELLNLRLADLAPGSTRLFISGNLAPDLFGFSLFETSLEETFQLLQTTDDVELADAVSTIGIRSAKEIRNFLNTIKAADLEVEISWNAGDSRSRRWTGTYESLSRLSRSLGQFRVVEPTVVSIVGEVVTVSSRGRFEILSGGKMYGGTFSADLLTQVAGIRIGDEAHAVVERSTVINTVTDFEKTTYQLTSIAPTGQTRFGVAER